MPMSANTQRTLKALRDRGFTPEIVERWLPIPGIPGGGKRRDFLGIIDIIAVRKGETLGVQSCGQAFAEHHRTIMAHENTALWLQAGNKLELWGWRKVKYKRGSKKEVWKPRIKVYRYCKYSNIVEGIDFDK